MAFSWSEIINGVLTFSATLGGILLERWFREKNSHKFSIDEYSNVLLHHMESIRDEMQADRVQYWVFTNGEKTYDGFYLENIRMVVEVNKDTLGPIIEDFVRPIPASVFSRNLKELKHRNDGIFLTYESDKDDKLGALNRAYNMNTKILASVYNKKKNKLSGILVVSYQEPNKSVSKERLAWLQVQVAAMIVSISKKNNAER